MPCVVAVNTSGRDLEVDPSLRLALAERRPEFPHICQHFGWVARVSPSSCEPQIHHTRPRFGVRCFQQQAPVANVQRRAFHQKHTNAVRVLQRYVQGGGAGEGVTVKPGRSGVCVGAVVGLQAA